MLAAEAIVRTPIVFVGEASGIQVYASISATYPSRSSWANTYNASCFDHISSKIDGIRPTNVFNTHDSNGNDRKHVHNAKRSLATKREQEEIKKQVYR